MTCMLYLVRHAIAEERAPSGRDADRRLTAEGAAKMQRVAAGLKRMGIAPDAIWTSPYRRTRETAELLCAALAPKQTPVLYAPLAAGTGAGAIIAGLKPGSSVHSLMLVGHEPDMSELTAQLTFGEPASSALQFKKGGAAAIEVEELPPTAGGTLCWLMTPKQLRALGE
jgi:phosphohistidine phosphatase